MTSLNKLDDFLKKWNFEDKAAANVLKENESFTKESFKFLVEYLATLSGANAFTLAEAKDLAVGAIVEFIKAPNMFQADLLDMPAIKQLENDAEHAAVYQLLLKIFLTQRLDFYMDFTSANAGVLKKLGLVHEDCVVKMRLISLVYLGKHDQIPYSLIKDTLKIEAGEVESWVTRAQYEQVIRLRN